MGWGLVICEVFFGVLVVLYYKVDIIIIFCCSFWFWVSLGLGCSSCCCGVIGGLVL